jgi:hypothetical protein
MDLTEDELLAARTDCETQRNELDAQRETIEQRQAKLDSIREQVDSFSLRRWGGQALGRRGTVLGTAGLLGRAVRKQARGQLEQVIQVATWALIPATACP